MNKTKVGIIGCGNISGIYFKNMCTVLENLEVVACSDLDDARTAEKVEEYPGVTAVSTDAMLADESIEVVVNLTTPQGHYPIAKRALEAGKHVYGEKPLTLTREEAAELSALAASKNLLIANAPDTFLGGGIQTCRKLIDDGWIGTPVGATAFMTCPGHESWHPDPEFYYKAGGGPMLDMGPYYLTAMVSLLGSVERVTGATRISRPTRTITSEKKRGTIVDVEVPTFVAGLLNFSQGAIGTIITTFDVYAANLPCIEIYGTEGSLSVPDPNGFGGSVKLKRFNSPDWADVPLTHGYAENGRGLGVADLASAAANGRAPRASGALAEHVLDIMLAIHDASDADAHVKLATTCDRPAPMPLGLRDGQID